MRLVAMFVALTWLTGCDFINSGDAVVSGNDNVLVRDDVVDRVAERLVGFDTTSAVTDEELLEVYASIRQRAREGDLQAALVVLKVAALQRRDDGGEGP